MISNRKIIDALRKRANHFSSTDVIERKNLLQVLSAVKLFSADDLVAYHDCLLLLLAYPQNKTLHQFATNELQRLASISKQINIGENQKEIEQLSTSGIEGTYLIASFSLDLCEWINNEFPSHIQLYSCDATVKTQLQTLKVLLPYSDYSKLKKGFDGVENWLEKNEYDENNFQLFLKLFQNTANLEKGDNLFTSLKVFIQLDVGNSFWSRTFNRGINSKVFYHTTGLTTKVDLLKTVNEPVAKSIKINASQKLHLAKSAKCSLTTLFRETDPITYSNYKETQWFELERGYCIAVFFMKPERGTLPETFVAYMIFKNNIPVSYGDVLILSNHARLAFNIYESYRGSESTYIYCNVLRLFHQRFNIDSVEIEPYQIGFKNDEAIQSGSFWFYYKLGFKPVKPRQKAIAEKEFEKINSDKKYRTPVATLKELAKSSLQLSLIA